MPVPVLTLKEMKEVEKQTTKNEGISELEMIRHAGKAVFDSLESFISEWPQPKQKPVIAFVCGKGHNGADGLAAAALAFQAGYPTVIYHFHSDKGYSEETETFLGHLEKLGVKVHTIKSPVDLPVFREVGMIVDAIFGTGITREPEGLLRDCIFGMNRSNLPILSIDVPSGIHGDKAGLSESIVKATACICLGSMKISAIFQPASQAFGKLGFSPVCFDEELLFSQPSHARLYTREDAVFDYPTLPYNAHKYTAGKVVVIGGSLGMHGAPLLAAKAAISAGAGMVRLFVPDAIFPSVGPQCLEVMAKPVGENHTHFIPQMLDEVTEWLEWADCVVLGPGMGRKAETLEFLKLTLEKTEGKVVLDGDGLQLLSRDQSGFNFVNSDHMVLTPHAGEYRNMGGKISEDVVENMNFLRELATGKKLNIALKGPTTLFCSASGEIQIMPVGSQALATAGSGDVLSGILSAMFCRMKVDKCVPLGVFVHGRAGDLCRENFGILGTTAGKIVENIGPALFELEELIEESTLD